MPMTQALYEAPRTVSDPDDCLFYHSFNYPDGTSVVGDWDMRGAFADYTGHVDFAGKRVLDIGTASGFLSFEAERCGAQVVSFDATSTALYCRLPHRDILFQKNPALAIRNDNVWLDRVKNSYWYSYARFASQNQVCYGNVHALPDELGLFDVAIIGQFLVHNRSAIDILESVAAKSSDLVVVTEGMIDQEAPGALFLGRADTPGNVYSNWLYSPGFYREVMGMMGFAVRSQTKARFGCNHVGQPSSLELTTMVFQRQP